MAYAIRRPRQHGLDLADAAIFELHTDHGDIIPTCQAMCGCVYIINVLGAAHHWHDLSSRYLYLAHQLSEYSYYISTLTPLTTTLRQDNHEDAKLPSAQLPKNDSEHDLVDAST
jgi:hypothetical protein